ncbi:MAG: hypothetical protein ACWA5W_01680, partial [Phycisphaerales bacterium]
MHDDQHDDGHDPDQLMFHQLADAPSPKRRRHCGIKVIHDTASPNTGSPKRSQAVLVLRWLLWDYIRSHGVGHEFQAIDFSQWASTRPQFDQSVDLRATGGMFIALVNAGIVEKTGYRNNGGNKDTNYHGTPRQVYRTMHIDYSRLGWLEDLDG